ncbi:hypothetical protein BX666DRAFT_596182 [Dichotomocladium elegans]|nr:hypothetical protein BX666DRAFT_596182 [Dichotomocladium elegans]
MNNFNHVYCDLINLSDSLSHAALSNSITMWQSPVARPISFSAVFKSSKKNRVICSFIFPSFISDVPGKKVDDKSITSRRASTAPSRVGDIVQCLPYHVMCRVFQYLPLEDILRFTSVSQAWFQFILNDVSFWERVVGDLSGVNHLIATSKIQYNNHNLRLYGPVSGDILGAFLKVICHVSYFTKLELERLNLALHPELSRRVIRITKLPT